MTSLLGLKGDPAVLSASSTDLGGYESNGRDDLLFFALFKARQILEKGL